MAEAMQKFEFQIMCADQGASCSRVQEIMKSLNFTAIQRVDDRKLPYDHVGSIELENADVASDLYDRIRGEAGANILGMSVAFR